MNQHDDKIEIFFRKRVEVGETKFAIPLPRYKIDDYAYNFQFDSLTLIPEFYSQQAQKMDFDSEEENNFPIKNPFQFEFEFTGDYYDKTSNANIWKPATGEKTLTQLIKSMNTFFDKIKPAGSLYPPVTVDWVASTYYDSGYKSIEAYHKLTAYLHYEEEYDEKFNNFLPAGHRRPSVNNMQFPTALDYDKLFTAAIIRFTVAPNVKLAFANNKLLEGFGFMEGQYIPKKHTSGQDIMENTTPEFLVFDGMGGIKEITDMTGIKLTVSQCSKKQVSGVGMFVTPRGQLKDLEKVSKNYIENVKALSTECNQIVSLEFDKNAKTFAFKFPDNPIVTTEVTLPACMSFQLGFGREKTRITKEMLSKAEPVIFGIQLPELERNARAIVYDIGMAIILIEESTNLQTVLFQNKVMATLEPEFDGTMTLKRKSLEGPKCYASAFGTPELSFIISRFSEDMKPVPIALPVGAYIQGTLVGQRIKGY